MIERVSEEAPEENSSHKEVIRTLASGINSFKSQLVNVTNRNKKMWRAVARSGSETATSSLSREQLELEGEPNGTPRRYNLRMTPTRQAVASRYQKQTATGERDNGGGGNSSDNVPSHSVSKTDESEQVITHRTTEPLNSAETVDSESAFQSAEPSVSDDAAVMTMEPSTLDNTATVTVPVTELERAKQMAQQLTALIANLECQESGFTVTSSEYV